ATEDAARRAGRQPRGGAGPGSGAASGEASGSSDGSSGAPSDVTAASGGVRAAAAYAADGMIGFESGGRRLTSRLLGGEFLKYSSRFPAEFGSRAEMPPGPLIEAVRRVSLVAERGSPVRLAFGAGDVVIEAGTQGQARATERVPAAFSGEERIIAFNPQYLLDGLTAAATTRATLGATAGAPGRVRPAPDEAGRAEDAADGAATGRGAAARGGGIRLEFTSAARPAVITWAPGEPGAEAEQPAEAEVPAEAEPARPDFRYLVVPLRIPGGV
ncbi:MAG TPA: DNA polymerase III subunit beta, partial [Streptosporangiaceae bacterium]|nr:DNA polymerase III subunit beta [Streptosporangiaceae bacterium]